MVSLFGFLCWFPFLGFHSGFPVLVSLLGLLFGFSLFSFWSPFLPKVEWCPFWLPFGFPFVVRFRFPFCQGGLLSLCFPVGLYLVCDCPFCQEWMLFFWFPFWLAWLVSLLANGGSCRIAFPVCQGCISLVQNYVCVQNPLASWSLRPGVDFSFLASCHRIMFRPSGVKTLSKGGDCRFEPTGEYIF